MDSALQNGLVSITSKHSVEGTLTRLRESLAAKNIMVFALIDHSGEAQKVGLSMPPTRVVIFGNPKGGTPLMLAAPSVAIDLPLKLLIAEDAQGIVTVTWNSPEYLKHRHNIPDALVANIAAISALAHQAAN